MDVSSISSLASLASTTSSSSSSDSADSLDMNDFFELLTAEMEYQDPLQPTDNTEFMSEMAQFSVLSAVDDMKTEENYVAGASMVGKDVLYKTTDSSGSTVEEEGTVEAVDFSNSTPSLYINGSWVTEDSVVRMTDTSLVSSDSSSSSSTTSS